MSAVGERVGDGATVLVVDDEPRLRRAVRLSLRAHGFAVREAADGEASLAALADGLPDLVVLDLGLPGLGGHEVLRRLRGFTAVPVIVLTARDGQAEKLLAFDSGADDYVTKPFDPLELVARIRALLRRGAAPPAAAVVVVDGLEIDLARRRVRRDGLPLHLTKTELALLELLVTNPGNLVTHDQLIRRVWGPAHAPADSQYTRVYIGQLRKKLGDAASRPRLILTEPGIGYRWIAGDDGPPG